MINQQILVLITLFVTSNIVKSNELLNQSTFLKYGEKCYQPTNEFINGPKSCGFGLLCRYKYHLLPKLGQAKYCLN